MQDMNELGRTVSRAVETLRQGGVILYPTDTIWGLGSSIEHPEAFCHLLDLKGRPTSQALILLVASIDMLRKYVPSLSEQTEQLIRDSERPLTLIFPHSVGIDNRFKACDGSIGIRVVRHRFCRILIETLRHPITSTSANIHGHPYKGYESIPESITSGVDYAVPRQYDETTDGRLPSRILRLETKGYTVIRD
ncbi:MAG: translation factor Sua5 [Bacteroidia bacterium]|nr:MAG: translation factor Sua5 [Bacteroidia bacterium]